MNCYRNSIFLIGVYLYPNKVLNYTDEATSYNQKESQNGTQADNVIELIIETNVTKVLNYTDKASSQNQDEPQNGTQADNVIELIIETNVTKVVLNYTDEASSPNQEESQNGTHTDNVIELIIETNVTNTVTMNNEKKVEVRKIKRNANEKGSTGRQEGPSKIDKGSVHAHGATEDEMVMKKEEMVKNKEKKMKKEGMVKNKEDTVKNKTVMMNNKGELMKNKNEMLEKKEANKTVRKIKRVAFWEDGSNESKNMKLKRTKRSHSTEEGSYSYGESGRSGSSTASSSREHHHHKASHQGLNINIPEFTNFGMTHPAHDSHSSSSSGSSDSSDNTSDDYSSDDYSSDDYSGSVYKKNRKGDNGENKGDLGRRRLVVVLRDDKKPEPTAKPPHRKRKHRTKIQPMIVPMQIPMRRIIQRRIPFGARYVVKKARKKQEIRPETIRHIVHEELDRKECEECKKGRIAAKKCQGCAKMAQILKEVTKKDNLVPQGAQQVPQGAQQVQQDAQQVTPLTTTSDDKTETLFQRAARLQLLQRAQNENSVTCSRFDPVTNKIVVFKTNGVYKCSDYQIVHGDEFRRMAIQQSMGVTNEEKKEGEDIVQKVKDEVLQKVKTEQEPDKIQEEKKNKKKEGGLQKLKFEKEPDVIHEEKKEKPELGLIHEERKKNKKKKRIKQPRVIHEENDDEKKKKRKKGKGEPRVINEEKNNDKKKGEKEGPRVIHEGKNNNKTTTGHGGKGKRKSNKRKKPFIKRIIDFSKKKAG